MLDSTTVWLTYGVAFAAALLTTLVLRVRHELRVWRVGATRPLVKLPAYQMALLSGGATRVALTGVVRLIGRGILVPGIAGVLTGGDASHAALDPVERLTLEAAKTPSLLQELLIRLTSLLKRKQIVARLRGELITIGCMRAFGSRRWWTDYARNMLAFALLLAAEVGGALSLDMTADAQQLAQQFIAWSFATMLVVALPGRVTPLGRYVVRSAELQDPGLKTARADHGDAIDIERLAQSVAVYGQSALAGSDMAWIPATMAHTDNSD
jgi:uncharacterized protein (TIGR04222 family)